MAMTNTRSPIALRAAELTDEELDYLIGQHEKTQGQTRDLSDEELDALMSQYEPAGGPAGAPPTIVPKQEDMSTGDIVAGGARELAGGAAFEFADEAEAAARAPFSDKSYEDLLADIRQNRARFSQEYPAASVGLNVAGGIAGMFAPGVGVSSVLGRSIIPMVTGLGRIASPLVRTAATGAAAGALSGFGSGENTGERFGNAAVGAGLGAALGTGFYGLGRGARWAREAVGARRAGQTEEDAARRAATIISRRMGEAGTTTGGLRDITSLERQYGIPSVLGTSTPGLSSLTESVVQTPSGGQEALATRLFERQREAPVRVAEKVRQSVPTPDYFAEHDRVLETLRRNANAAYERSYAAGEIRDPRIMEILNDPDVRAAYADALANVRRRQTEAVLRGEDPSQFSLREVFEPVLDAQGNLVDLSPTGKQIPDMRTLDQIKQALDRRVNALYTSGQGGEATALRGVRDAFVERLDTVGPPEYRAARQQYKGDIEIREALENGLGANNLRWQEVRKLAGDYSPGELQAFKTGYVQRLMQRLEDTSARRNFAREIIEKPSERKKLEALMEPGEFQLFETALRREADLFDTAARVTGGSATSGRIAARADIEEQISGGNLPEAAAMLLNPTPGNILQRTLRIAANMRNANVSRATYTQLARMLKAGTPDEINAVLTELEAAAPVQQAADSALQRRAGRAAMVAAKTIAPSPEMEKETLPEPGALQLPDTGMAPMSGLSAMPGGMPGGGGGPAALTADGGTPEEGTSGNPLHVALERTFPGYLGAFGRGVSTAKGFVEAADVEKALGLPPGGWLQVFKGR